MAANTRHFVHPKRTALPEHHDYQDTGCDVAPRCLACPLPDCKYVLGPRATNSIRVTVDILPGETTAEAAARHGVTPRTIVRRLQRQRESEHRPA